jgi:Domain of unknown function (DUF4190)
MTDQPTSGKDDRAHGEQPPSYTQPQGVGSPDWAAGSDTGPAYGRTHDQPYGQDLPYNQDSQPYGGRQDPPYGQGSWEFGHGHQSPAYGQAGQPYAAPGQPYAAPGAGYNAYGQPAYYGVSGEPKALSIASLCCGIAALVGFGFFLLPQIAAVILGHMALTREPAGRGMAIAGLVLGYVGVALAILVIVIFGIVISSARYTGYGA